MTRYPRLIPFPPNRVRRNYRGGRGIDDFEGHPDGLDNDQPEDWLASTVPANNPGMPPIPGEGIAEVHLGEEHLVPFKHLIEEAPRHFLGEEHVARHGVQLGFLAKLLDSAMRLHVQAHPTADFARNRLDSPWGKLETYVILGIRQGQDPWLRLGFQHAPTREEWRRIIEEQDIAAMDACFEPVPVHVGEAFVVPGGLPHAIGPGLFVLEVMEPSDLVVRCEFEREGIVVPPEARFMGRDLDFCLDIFDYTEYSVHEIRQRMKIQPELLSETDVMREERLIGSEQTGSFEIRRLHLREPVTLESDGRFQLVLVVGGNGHVEAQGEHLPLRRAIRYFQAAANPHVRYVPNTPLDLILILPPDAPPENIGEA